MGKYECWSDTMLYLSDNLNDTENSCEIIDDKNGTPTKFKPLNAHEQKMAALKFFLVINETTHVINYYGIGNVFPNPPIVTQSAAGNSACLIQFILYFVDSVRTVTMQLFNTQSAIILQKLKIMTC